MENTHKRTMRGLRNDLELSQVEMAEKLGIPTSNYQRYEQKKTLPPLDVAINFADIVGIVDIREIQFK